MYVCVCRHGDSAVSSGSQALSRAIVVDATGWCARHMGCLDFPGAREGVGRRCQGTYQGAPGIYNKENRALKGEASPRRRTGSWG